MNVRSRCFLMLAVWAGLLIGAVLPVLAQDEDESMQDARLLFKSALDLKKQGKLTEAALAYEQAVRKNRAILGEDDQGLIAELQKVFESRLASAPDDIKSLEGLGFLHAVCHSDFPKALTYYEKVIQLSPDQGVRERTAFLVERLRAMGDQAAKVQEDMATSQRDERLKEWAEMEKQEALAAQTAQEQKEAATIGALGKTKEDLEARIPQMEDELKALEEEYKKANRLWYTLKDDRYDRKRDRLEKEIEQKKQALEEAKDKLEEATSKLDAYDAAQEKKNAPKPGPGGETPATPEAGTPPDGQPAAPEGNPPIIAPGDPGAPPPDQPGDQPMPPADQPLTPIQPGLPDAPAPDTDPVLPALGDGSAPPADGGE